MATAKKVPTTSLTGSGANPFLVENVKYYVFNETGNIMVSTTEVNTTSIEQSVRDVFNEATVFFAAMTKAITSTPVKTPIPGAKNPQEFYTIYDYDILQKVIDGSGLFIQMTEEDISYTSTKFGVEFSKELIEGLLGLASGAGALNFASGLISSLGNAGLSIGGSYTSTSNKVAHIVFVCEYLLGMPVISAVVISVDSTDVRTAVHIGPCIKASESSVTMKMHKDTYLFVTPTFIKRYAGDLESVVTDAAYNEFVAYLESLITETPAQSKIVAIMDDDGGDAASSLDIDTTYTIIGNGFSNVSGIFFGDSSLKCQLTMDTSNSSESQLVFTGYTGSAPSKDPQKIYIYDDAAKLLVASDEVYEFAMSEIDTITDNKGRIASPLQLDVNMTYTINGSGLANAYSLYLGDRTNNVLLNITGTPTDATISFKGVSGSIPLAAQLITIYDKQGNQLAASAGSYQFSAQAYNVQDAQGNNAKPILSPTLAYTINGSLLTGAASVCLGTDSGKVQLSNFSLVNASKITFTGYPAAVTLPVTPQVIGIYDSTGLLMTATTDSYLFPVIAAVNDPGGTAAPSGDSNPLTATESYTIQGTGFGTTPGTASLGTKTTKNLLKITGWSDTAITFSGMNTGSTAPSNAAAININDAGGNLLATSALTYKMG